MKKNNIVHVTPCNMAKLYWRVKRDGKWTYVAASVVHQEWISDELTVYLDNVPGVEEE